MFFTSGIMIAFFCFSFYLIWNQFLKKDTRLNIGLQVLKKKITELENLSLHVETQVNRCMSVIQDKSIRIDTLLQKTEIISNGLEQTLKQAEELQNLQSSKRKTINTKVSSEQHLNFEDKLKDKCLLKEEKMISTDTDVYLKIIKDKTDLEKQNKHQFGKSPFKYSPYSENEII